MNITFYHCKDFELPFLEEYSNRGYTMNFIPEALSKKTALACKGSQVIAVHSQDDLSEDILNIIYDHGVRFITTRSTGYNHIDLEVAHRLGIKVANVPAYSPESIAEYAIMLMLTIARKFIKSQANISKDNFDLDGLVGSTLFDKTIGIIGTGRIGRSTIKILNGFGAKVLAYDIDPKDKGELLFDYVDLEYLLKHSDIVSLHIPLNESTRYFISANRLDMMKKEVIIINTGRGGLINTLDLIDSLELKQIAAAGLDVYEFEENIFFKNHTKSKIEDFIFNRLRNHPNVLISGHQAYLTNTALKNIAKTTFYNIRSFDTGTDNHNLVKHISSDVNLCV